MNIGGRRRKKKEELTGPIYLVCFTYKLWILIVQESLEQIQTHDSRCVKLLLVPILWKFFNRIRIFCKLFYKHFSWCIVTVQTKNGERLPYMCTPCSQQSRQLTYIPPSMYYFFMLRTFKIVSCRYLKCTMNNCYVLTSYLSIKHQTVLFISIIVPIPFRVHIVNQRDPVKSITGCGGEKKVYVKVTKTIIFSSQTLSKKMVTLASIDLKKLRITQYQRQS